MLCKVTRGRNQYYRQQNPESHEEKKLEREANGRRDCQKPAVW